MSHSTIDISYQQGLKPLEELLEGVKRPGDFFVHGRLISTKTREKYKELASYTGKTSAPWARSLRS